MSISNKERSKESIHANKWMLSIAINIVIITAVMLATPMMYESNDDFSIAIELAKGYPYISFVNYYLCKVLIAIQSVISDINIFILSQIIMSFISFCCIMKVILERSKEKLEILFAVMICVVFSLDHYSDIQFTKTAALLMTTGLFLLIDNHINERRIPEYIIASLLFFIGAGYRDNGLIPITAYGGIALAVWIIREKRVRNIKEVMLLVIIALILIAPQGFDAASDAMNRSTPELKLSREYQSARIRITDYPLIGHYEKAKAEYDAINISENDINLLNGWFFDYEGVASLEELKKINSVNQPYVESNRSIWKAFKKSVKYALKSVVEIGLTGIHIFIITILIIVIVFSAKKRQWIYVAPIIALTVSVYIAIFFMQRAQYRALYLGDLGATLWILYILITSEAEDKIKLRKKLCVVGIVATIIMLIPARDLLVESNDFKKKIIEDEIFTEYYSNHLDTLYIVPARTMSQPKEFLTPLKTPFIPDNVAATGGWETLTPFELNRLEKYNVYNPMKDMINNPKVLYLGENIETELIPLTEYYRKWYCDEGEDVRFEKVDEVDGVGMYNIIIE